MLEGVNYKLCFVTKIKVKELSLKNIDEEKIDRQFDNLFPTRPHLRIQ